jgi:hypothetical protein
VITATLLLLAISLVRSGVAHRRLNRIYRLYLHRVRNLVGGSPAELTELQAESRTARFAHLISAASCVIILVWGSLISLMGLP